MFLLQKRCFLFIVKGFFLLAQRLSRLRGISNFLTATTPMLMPAMMIRKVKVYKDSGKEQKRVWAPR